MSPRNQRLAVIMVATVLLGVALLAVYLQRGPARHPQTAHFTAAVTPPVRLADRFASGTSLAAVREQLQDSAAELHTDTRAAPPDPAYPPYRLDTLTADGYRLADSAGRLSLLFFNDRLFEVRYAPDDAAAFLRAAGATLPRPSRSNNGRAERITGPLRIYSTVAYAQSEVGRALGAEAYLLWQDLRLIAQRDEWDAAYGSLPIRFTALPPA